MQIIADKITPAIISENEFSHALHLIYCGASITSIHILWLRPSRTRSRRHCPFHMRSVITPRAFRNLLLRNSCCQLMCQTHATAIAKNNGTHRTYFNANENYEVFYNYVCLIMRGSFADAGVRLQELLVLSLLWSRCVRETRAADWFERYWCCPIKGRWLLANGGIAITGNNQGLESTWRWDRMANSQRYQVCGQRIGGSGQRMGGSGQSDN